MGNPKLETRNPKFEIRNSKSDVCLAIFEFRISSFDKGYGPKRN
jgi:hypothetical protein